MLINNSQKEKSLIKNYVSLIKNKNSSLINKLKCEKRNLPKVSYKNNFSLSYDIKKLFNKEGEKVEIKKVNMIHYNNRKILFVLKNEDLLIYEMKEEPFSLILLKNIMKNYFFNMDLNVNMLFNYLNFFIVLCMTIQ